MHGFSSGYTFLVNAEVDPMGGVVDGGVGIGTKPSPRRAAIEKAQADLILEYDVREQRRRELEFLEKGGNPLDFKFGHAASLSVHSTSHAHQHPDQFLTSEAKGSFALTASLHGDSVESSGRLGVIIACEPNSGDNFNGENELLESERKSRHPGRGSVTPSEHSSQLDRGQNVKELEDSPIFHPKKGQAYRRRNRSRPGRDGPRSSSGDKASRGGHGPSLPSRPGMVSKPIACENQFEMESDGTHAPHLSTNSRASEFPEGKPDVSTSKDKQEEMQNKRVKAEEASVATSGPELDMVAGKENIVPVGVECPPCSGAEQTEDSAAATQLNVSANMNGDGKCTQTEGLISNALQTTEALDPETSCTRTSLNIDGNGNIDSELYTNIKNVNSNGATKEHELSLWEKSFSKDEKMLNEKHVTNAIEMGSCIKEDQKSIGHQGNGFADKDQEEIDKGRSSPTHEAKGSSSVGEQKANNHTETKSEIQPQTCDGDQLKLVDKAHEDRILEEARIIEAKRKRIAELSVGSSPREYRRKSQWDFVLEEMAWLANDFAQERLWKMTAASQICHRVAFASRLRLEEQNKCWKQKSVAHTLAKAVMEFWHSARLLVDNVNSSQSEKCIDDARAGELEFAECKVGGPDKDKQKLQSCGWKNDLAVHRYAVRFLQFNCSSTPRAKIEVSGTPGIGSAIDVPEVSWQDQLTEENLFYVVPPGAMETYRKSIESCLVEPERKGNNMQEEVDTSMYAAAAAEFGYQENNYEEDEGENVFYLPGAFDTGKPSKKKKKNMKSCAARSHVLGADFGYGHSTEKRNGTPHSALMGKRPSNSLHAGPIPTKRMRTASRQRIVGPFNAGHAGVASAPSRADVSSGDTNSFQDDQSTLNGGSVIPRGSEVDSALDFEKQSTFDSTDISPKPKKKKKFKHQGSTYDQRRQLESTMQNQQKDHVRKRLDGYQFESNGNSGLFGQHAKKPKILKQSLDSSFDNAMPMSGSVASPVASQMSNMSNQSKIIKLIGGRDRSRKAKALKVPAGQPGFGSPWSLFEDQALVVLVHDMGPNWELVSDAINSTLQFKCIFRKPQECKERHKILMDRTSSDGADSAEDSGSSQPYPSTLPGIPKGSARQLFQRLQGPMEEDTIKSHFEKIIHIGQQLHYRKKQNDNQDLKQIAPAHGSHVVALSQVIPNNVNGGILTPLDLCDAASDEDLLPLGYQGPHAGGLTLSNQGVIPSMHHPNGPDSSLQGVQGSPSMGIGNNLAASSSQFNSPRISGHRPGSLPIEEQQRLQQYNHMLSGRNIQPGNLPTSGSLSGTDRAVRMLPSGNGSGMMAGMNRSMPMPRPGLPGITSSSMLSGTMLPNNMNMHSGTAPGHGNSMFRPRNALHMVRPGQSSEHLRQMMLPEMQMQGTQSNNPGVSPFGGLNSGFTTQSAASPPVQTYPGHQQQQQHPMPQKNSHVLSSHHSHLPGSNNSATPEQQQQAMICLRERQMQQQRLLQRQQQQHQHQHQQLPASNAVMTHVQIPTPLPLPSAVQSSSQLQSQASSQPVSSQPHGVGRSAQSAASGMMNQVGKQRLRQAQAQYQPSGRQHPQQRQLPQSQNQVKVLKGMGRSNMLLHQNLPMDPSHLNGISAKPGAKVADKAEHHVHLMQQSKPLASPQTSNHSQSQKTYADTVSATSKPVQQIPSHLDGGNQSQIPASASNQGVSSTLMPSFSHQQLQGQLKPPLKGVNQPLQRSIQQSRQVNSDPLIKPQADHTPTAGVDSKCDSAPSSSTSSGAIGSPVVTNSGNVPLPSVSQGLLQKQVSGNLVAHGHSVGAQWQQKQQSQLQRPLPLEPMLLRKQSQQPLQQLEQSPQRVPQQQP